MYKQKQQKGKGNKMNNYTKGCEIIKESCFTLKSVKTFLGMEGYGVNANLYYKASVIAREVKVATLIDSGNGGCLDIDWVWRQDKDGNPYIPIDTKQAQNYLKILIATLPKATWGEMSEDRGEESIIEASDNYDWDEESVMNLLINFELDCKEWKKALRNV